MSAEDAVQTETRTAGEEWYPRECEFCEWAAALACADPYCRERGFGEHRGDCATLRDAAVACDCLQAEVEAQ